MQYIDPKPILDEDETIDMFIEGDKDAYFAISVFNNRLVFMVVHSGFEFFFEFKPVEES
jgi:hypothetical protein